VVVKDSVAHYNAVFYPAVVASGYFLKVTHITRITRGSYDGTKENHITVSNRILNPNNPYN
jgi:hypothetical protein